MLFRSAGVLTPPLAGIGRSSAVALSVAGWAVVLSGRRKQELDETAALCGPGPALAVVGDITKEEDVVALFKAGEDKFGEPQLYSVYQSCAHCACLQEGSTCCSTYDPHLDVERRLLMDFVLQECRHVCTRCATRGPHAGPVAGRGGYQSHGAVPLHTRGD